MNIKTNPPIEMQGKTVLRKEPTFPVRLTDAALEDLELKVKKHIEEFRRNTSGLQRRLQELNDILEGVVREVEFPFRNASNVDVKLQIGTARTFRATVVRSAFGDPRRVFVASSVKDTPKDELNGLEQAFNWLAVNRNNLVAAMKSSIIPVFRDGTAFLFGKWNRKVEKAIDSKTYMTVEEFAADFPSPEAAGMTEEAYEESLRRLSETDGETAYLDATFEHDEVLENEADFSVIELAKFVWFPTTAPSLSRCLLYGFHMEESATQMREKKKSGEYKESVVQQCLDGAKAERHDAWDSARDFIEGLSGRSEEKDRFENYYLVLRMDLDGDDIPEKYAGVFSWDAGKFLKLERYWLRKNIDCLVPLRFVARHGRLLGASLLWDGADIFDEINSIHRHRNNRRMITDSPAFIADEQIKEKGDFGAAEFEWRPGLVVWVAKAQMDGIKEIEVSSNSRTDDLDEESLLVRYVEFVVGPTQGISGQESQEDPRAPATKHLSKIRQAGFRLDDNVDEFKSSFPAIGRLGMALYYQYGDSKVEYFDDERELMDVRRDIFGLDGVVWELNASSVGMSPEFEMERVMALRQEAAQNPVVVQMKPQVLGLLWDRFVSASRVPNPEELKLGQMAAPAPPPAVSGAVMPAVAGNGGLKNLISSLGLERDLR